MSSRNKRVADPYCIIRKILAIVVLAAILGSGAAVFGQNDWKAEFDDICSRTDQALTLSQEEISALIQRCDRLKPAIEQLEESQKKVYLRRLQLCRNLFAFALDSLKNK